MTLKTTLGNIKIKMEPDWAPENVRNFLKLTQSGWYNGTVFHRIAKDFVVQGGDGGGADPLCRPLGASSEGRVSHGREAHARDHIDGAWGRPEFGHDFVLPDAGAGTNLDSQFSAFGRVVEGTDVLDAFAKEELEGETPKRRLEIVEATIDR